MIAKKVALAMLATAAVLWAQDADVRIREKLATARLNADFEDAPLTTVVEFLRQATDVNILIDTKAIPTPEEYHVTFQLRNVRADHMLGWALRGKGLAWALRDGVILITTGDSMSAERSELRLYEVSDLLARPRDFPANEAEQGASFTQDDLVELLKQMIDPNSWDSSDRSLQSTQGQVVVVCPPEVHEKVERVLSAMRYLANFTVTCEARVLDLAPASKDGLPSLASLAAGKVILSKEEAAALLAAPKAAATVREALRFTCVNGQRMHVVLSRTRESVHGLLSRWADAIVEGKTAETMIEVLPILAVGRDEVLVDLDARLADPPSAPDTLETSFGALQLARSAARRVRTTFSVPNGGGALMALGVSGDRVRALLLRVTSNAQPLTVTPAPPEAAQPEDDAALRTWNRFREMPISVDLNNVKLHEFVRRIQESGEINCVIDPVLAEDGATDMTILLRVNEIPGELLVKLVTQMLGIGYAFRDEVLLFTRPDRREEAVVQVYDVRDLLTQRRDYPGPVLSPTQEAGVGFELDPESVTTCFVDELVGTVRTNIDPSSWEEYSDRTGILMLSGALYVLQFPSVHEKIRKLLEDFRASRPRQVQVDARVIDLDSSVHDALDAGAGGALPDASRAAIEAALAGGQARTAAFWSVLGLNGQRFHATMFAQQEYVDDYDADEKSGEPDPVYEMLQTGFGVDVRPTLPSAEDGNLSVEVHVQCCDVSDPLPSQKTGELLVQTPAVDRATLHTTVLPEAGRAYLFTLGSSTVTGSDRRRVLLLTVREAK